MNCIAVISQTQRPRGKQPESTGQSSRYHCLGCSPVEVASRQREPEGPVLGWPQALRGTRGLPTAPAAPSPVAARGWGVTAPLLAATLRSRGDSLGGITALHSQFLLPVKKEFC